MRQPPIITPAEADLAYAAAQRVVETHRRMVEFIRVGQTLAQIDAEVARVLAALECRSCFLHYRVGRSPAYPSHACLSVNSCIVHGTPGFHTAPLAEGDLLKLDIGVVHRGWIGDAGWTYAIKRVPSEAARRLMEAGKTSLARGVKELRPGNRYVAWARAVQTCVEDEYGFHLTRGLGGHGIGRYKNERERGLHLPPYVSNVVPTQHGEWPEGEMECRPGTLVAVEPMLSLGTGKTVSDSRLVWPVSTADGSLAAHYEHDVLITEQGPRVMSEGMEQLPDVIG
ncbi:MAG: M24 family metallopeptidase [Phycisphaerales bacterium]